VVLTPIASARVDAAAVLRGEALLHEVLCRFGQMACDLVFDLAIHLPRAHEG
jgi:hypothetical protein